MSSPSRSSHSVSGAGVLVLLLGVWGALVPFVGPSFGYGMGGASAWTWSESHATLHLAPGVAAIIGGVLLSRGGKLATKRLGALVAAAGGTWFIIGPSLHPLWAPDRMSGMGGMGTSALSSALSSLGYHYGTGALIALIAAYALGVLRTRAAMPGTDQHLADHERATGPETALVESHR